MEAKDFLNAAAGHMTQRAGTYDKPEGERSMAKTVAAFNVFHGTQLTEAQGWHFMQILKDVRLFARRSFHSDSAEDGVAYAALKSEAKAAERQPANDNGVWCCNGGLRTPIRCAGCAEPTNGHD